MESITILQARTIAFLQTEELDPRGKVSAPDLLKAFGGQYEFSVLPQVFGHDFDPQKGIEFRCGKLGTINIEKILVFPRAVAVDTRSSTDDSDYVLDEALRWVQKFVGRSTPIQLPRRSYWSQLSFQSDFRLSLLNPIFEGLATRITDSVSQQTNLPLQYELVSFNLHFDQLMAKFTPGYFSIERLVDTPFSDNKYFSNAPLKTTEHVCILEEFEAALLAKS